MSLTAKAQPSTLGVKSLLHSPPPLQPHGGSHTMGDREPPALPLRPGLGGGSCVVPGFTRKQGFCQHCCEALCCAGGGTDRGDMGLTRSHLLP